jgi:ankyrin repeat protein
LGAAANHGDYELAKWLLEHGAHANIANADGTTPLMMMFLPFRNALADTRIIELLIRYGVNIRAEDDYALKYACLFGEYESVQILLRNGANVHAENEQPLFYAATKGYENIVRLLLSRGARADADIIRQAKTDKIRNIIRQHILRPPPIRDVHNTPPVQGIPMRPIRDMRPEALFLNNEL